MTVIIRAQATDGVIIAGDGRTCAGFPPMAATDFAQKIRVFEFAGGGGVVTASSGRACIDAVPIGECISDVIGSALDEDPELANVDHARIGQGLRDLMYEFNKSIECRPACTGPVVGDHAYDPDHAPNPDNPWEDAWCEQCVFELVGDETAKILLQYFDQSGPTECFLLTMDPIGAAERSYEVDELNKGASASSTQGWLSVQGQFAQDEKSATWKRSLELSTESAPSLDRAQDEVQHLVAMAYGEAPAAAAQKPYTWTPDCIFALEVEELLELRLGPEWSAQLGKRWVQRLGTCSYEAWDDALKHAQQSGEVEESSEADDTKSPIAELVDGFNKLGGDAGVGGLARLVTIRAGGAWTMEEVSEEQVHTWMA